MKRNLLISMLLFVIIGGCNTATNDVNAIDDEFLEDQKIIRTILDDIFIQAQQGNMDVLQSYHLESPKFTDFGSSGGNRGDYEEMTRSEYDFFTSISELDFSYSDVQVDVFDDAAIATFYLEFSWKMEEDNFHKNVRGTLVFIKDQGKWKITHEHLSPYMP